jgi:hypothetical protein
VKRVGCANCAIDGAPKIVVEGPCQLARMPLEGTMSKATIVCVCIMAAAFAACATGGSDSGGGTDAAVRQDAANVTAPDAPRADASVGVDAQVSQLPDAGSGSGSGSLFCATNSECTVAGECCLTLGGPQGFCAPGTVVLGQCFPE